MSEWGHDFRPDYLKLGALREQLSSVPWVALTATAIPKVKMDITTSLQLHEPVAIYKASCFRSNLFYDIWLVANSASQMIDEFKVHLLHIVYIHYLSSLVSYKETLADPVKDLKDFATKALTASHSQVI